MRPSCAINPNQPDLSTALGSRAKARPVSMSSLKPGRAVAHPLPAAHQPSKPAIHYQPDIHFIKQASIKVKQAERTTTVGQSLGEAMQSLHGKPGVRGKATNGRLNPISHANPALGSLTEATDPPAEHPPRTKPQDQATPNSPRQTRQATKTHLHRPSWASQCAISPRPNRPLCSVALTGEGTANVHVITQARPGRSPSTTGCASAKQASDPPPTRLPHSERRLHFDQAS